MSNNKKLTDDEIIDVATSALVSVGLACRFDPQTVFEAIVVMLGQHIEMAHGYKDREALVRIVNSSLSKYIARQQEGQTNE